MLKDCDLSFEKIDKITRTPIHDVLKELGEAAVHHNVHRTEEFQKLIAFVLEIADGRDRREQWTQKPGIALPIPKLRVAIQQTYGQYGELQWFKLNKTANKSGLPLYGMFPRCTSSVARVTPSDFGSVIAALVSPTPDATLLRFLHKRGGKINGMGMELFARLAYVFRRELYFIFPQTWADTSGCTKYIGDDLRKYCAVCRSLRTILDQLGVTPAIRGSVLLEALSRDDADDELTSALNRALGPALLKYTLLNSDDAYEPNTQADDQSSMPLKFAAKSIRARRGDQRLRNLLRQSYGDRCGISGPCPRDLLEVAYIVPFPKGNVHALTNALLLRSDLHTLWDLNLIGIDPDDLKVWVSNKLNGTIYQELDGQSIVAPQDGSVVNASSLRERWKAFHTERSSETQKKSSAQESSLQRMREEAFPERESMPVTSHQESHTSVEV